MIVRHLLGVIAWIQSKEDILNYGFKYLNASVDVLDTTSPGDSPYARYFRMDFGNITGNQVVYPTKGHYELKTNIDGVNEPSKPIFWIGCHLNRQFIDLLINELYLSTD